MPKVITVSAAKVSKMPCGKIVICRISYHQNIKLKTENYIDAKRNILHEKDMHSMRPTHHWYHGRK